MTRTLMLGACAMSLAIGGCVSTHRENAALRMAWPQAPTADLSAAARPTRDDPTIGGDILKGSSIADLAAARAAAAKPLDIPDGP